MRVAGYGGLAGKLPAANTRTQYPHTQKLIKANTVYIFHGLSKHVQIQHIPDIQGQFRGLTNISSSKFCTRVYIYLTLPNQKKTRHSRHEAPALLLPVLVAAGISGVKSLLEGRIYLSGQLRISKGEMGRTRFFHIPMGSMYGIYIHIYIYISMYLYMDVSENRGTPKFINFKKFSIINPPFWGTTIFGNTHIYTYIWFKF